MSSNLHVASGTASSTTEVKTTEAMVSTRTKVDRFQWTINNFTSKMRSMKTNERLESPLTTFSSAAEEPQTWRLVVYPNGQSIRGYVAIYLKLCATSKAAVVKRFFRISLVNAKEKKILMFESDQRVFDLNDAKPSWGCLKMLSHERLTNETNGLLPDDKLTIVCELFEKQPFKMPDCRLAEDFAGLFESPKFSDLTIVVDGREIPAHKNILAARSSVFASNLAIKSETPNRMEVPDTSYEVFKELLRYVYRGEVMNMANLAERLLVAADKYKLNRLRILCEESLSASIGVQNAGQLLITSDRCNADQLKGRVIDFISKHALEVKGNAAFEQAVSAKPLLMLEALGLLAERLNKESEN